ncbi:HD family hydrolase [Ralstonia thomasii]|jgi:hypothetical protein
MTWILTASGKHFDYADPQPDQIDILDIAQALAYECRYAGHARRFYSVAQHSVMASQIVTRDHAVEALLHDATEAYCKDIPRPLKALLPDYRAVEHRVDAVIRSHFGLPAKMSDAVTHADLVMLATERRDLMPDDDTPWPILEGIEPMTRRMNTLHPERAQAMFIRRWVELTGQRHA